MTGHSCKVATWREDPEFIAARNEEEEEAHAFTALRRSAGIAPINHTLI